MSSGSAPQADAVHAWMNEGYAPGSSLNHASQCLWSGSTQVGCASASGACGTVIACDYDPVGNFVGESAY